ncbi:MAG: MFS transporter [Gammaproteobacteria bacterium]|nr:MFS transporter [Gammaproteobacteria bacterium]MBT8435873.1 MFS transporter [Gammaproteobacteria bacterium]
MVDKLESLYEYLADEEDARVCKDIPDSACREVPGNFFAIFVTQFLTKLGDSLASSKVVLPWLLTSVGAPAFFAGILVPIRESGSMLPQLFIGGFVRRYPLRKWFFVLGSALQGIAVCGIAWVGLSFDGYTAGVLVTLLLVVFSLSRGLCSVASKDVMGKTIPKTRRGLLTGYCSSASGLVTIGVGAGFLFVTSPDADNYAMLLFAAGLCWIVATLTYARVNEYRGATEGGGNAFEAALASLSLLRRDAVFRNFVVTRCLLMSSGLAAPFLIILAREASADSSLLNLGLFIIAGGVAGFCSGVVWGKLADLSSRKVLMLTAAATCFICAVASGLALTANSNSLWLVLGLFFLLSVTHEGVRLGRKTYLVDMAAGNRRTEYVAVSNSIIGLLLLIVGLAGAVLAQFSLVAVLALFALSGLLAVLTGLRLPEVQQ